MTGNSLESVIIRLRRFSERAPAIVQKIVADESRTALAGMRAKFVPYPGASGSELNARRGNLMRALGVAIKNEPNRVTGVIGVLENAPYNIQQIAHVQEFGKQDIRPVRAQKLAIPINKALNAMGVRVFFNVKDAERVYNTFSTSDFIKGRLKNSGRGNAGPVENLFKREESVDVPARPFIRPQLQPLYDRVLGRLNKELPEAL